MRVVLFGATGMVGQGVLRECLLDPGVESVLTIGRSATGVQNPKLREIVQKDLYDYSNVEGELPGLDACFFCLGASSNGVAEAEYTRFTYDLTMAAADTLARLNPQMTFIYTSGTGADSSEKGSVMWARVRGRTENALMRLPFKAAYVFRPAAIQPMNGEKSRTALYRVLYTLTKPLLPAFRIVFPGFVLTTEEIGLAMLLVAKRGAPKKVMESRDIAELIRRS